MTKKSLSFDNINILSNYKNNNNNGMRAKTAQPINQIKTIINDEPLNFGDMLSENQRNIQNSSKEALKEFKNTIKNEVKFEKSTKNQTSTPNNTTKERTDINNNNNENDSNISSIEADSLMLDSLNGIITSNLIKKDDHVTQESTKHENNQIVVPPQKYSSSDLINKIEKRRVSIDHNDTTNKNNIKSILKCRSSSLDNHRNISLMLFPNKQTPFESLLSTSKINIKDSIEIISNRLHNSDIKTLNESKIDSKNQQQNGSKKSVRFAANDDSCYITNLNTRISSTNSLHRPVIKHQKNNCIENKHPLKGDQEIVKKLSPPQSQPQQQPQFYHPPPSTTSKPNLNLDLTLNVNDDSGDDSTKTKIDFKPPAYPSSPATTIQTPNSGYSLLSQKRRDFLQRNKIKTTNSPKNSPKNETQTMNQLNADKAKVKSQQQQLELQQKELELQQQQLEQQKQDLEYKKRQLLLQQQQQQLQQQQQQQNQNQNQNVSFNTNNTNSNYPIQIPINNKTPNSHLKYNEFNYSEYQAYKQTPFNYENQVTTETFSSPITGQRSYLNDNNNNNEFTFNNSNKNLKNSSFNNGNTNFINNNGNNNSSHGLLTYNNNDINDNNNSELNHNYPLSRIPMSPKSTLFNKVNNIGNYYQYQLQKQQQESSASERINNSNNLNLQLNQRPSSANLPITTNFNNNEPQNHNSNAILTPKSNIRFAYLNSILSSNNNNNNNSRGNITAPMKNIQPRVFSADQINKNYNQ
jgi:hypothetical protein